MTDTKRTVFISLGTSLLVVILVPLLVCLAMVPGMNGMMGADSDMMSHMGGPTMWFPIGLVLLLLVAGVALLRLGVRRPK